MNAGMQFRLNAVIYIPWASVSSSIQCKDKTILPTLPTNMSTLQTIAKTWDHTCIRWCHRTCASTSRHESTLCTVQSPSASHDLTTNSTNLKTQRNKKVSKQF